MDARQTSSPAIMRSVVGIATPTTREDGAWLALPPGRGGFAGDLGALLRGEFVGASSAALEPAGAAGRPALGRGGLLGIADGLGDDLMRELVGIARALGCASEHGAGRWCIARAGNIDHLLATPVRLWVIGTVHRRVNREELPRGARTDSRTGHCARRRPRPCS